MDKEQKQKAIDTCKANNIAYNVFETTNGKECILREPTVLESADLIPLIYDYIGNRKPNYREAGQKVIELCWVAGDDEVRKHNSDENVQVAMTAFMLIDVAVAEIKKN